MIVLRGVRVVERDLPSARAETPIRSDEAHLDQRIERRNLAGLEVRPGVEHHLVDTRRELLVRGEEG